MKRSLKKLALTTGVSLSMLSATTASQAAPDVPAQMQIETLLQDVHLRQQIKNAKNPTEVNQILAGVSPHLDSSDLLALTEKQAVNAPELSEADLLGISGSKGIPETWLCSLPCSKLWHC
ncbi:MAG: hypothetical protein AAF572_21930 [Cyanobacteria bacterium P01_B01_bin.77]